MRVDTMQKEEHVLIGEIRNVSGQKETMTRAVVLENDTRYAV